MVRSSLLHRVLGVLFLVLGFGIVLNSFQGITGFVVFKGASVGWGWFLGVVFVVIGVLVLTTAVREREGDLETQLKKPKPGNGFPGEFVSLKKLIRDGRLVSNKNIVQVSGANIYRDGNLVQGLTIKGDYVEFVGYHFTNPETAKIITEDKTFEIKNLHDPYIYFLEPRDFSGKSEREVRHMTGAASGSEVLTAKIKYPIEGVKLKFYKNYPISIAVDGDIAISNLVKRKGHYIKRRSLENL